ncbi:MAG: LptE family protein [Elusimicrobiota bacterium]
MNMLKKLTMFIILLQLMIIGCGVYEPMEIVPDHIQTIRIVPFKNETQEMGLSSELTEEVINEFIKDGRLTVVNSDKADSILKGTIIEYTKIPISYDENFIATEFKLNMIINLSYYDNIEKLKLWEDKREGFDGGIENWVKYYVQQNAEFVETEEEAIQRLVEDTADKILHRTVYGWE